MIEVYSKAFEDKGVTILNNASTKEVVYEGDDVSGIKLSDDTIVPCKVRIVQFRWNAS